MNQMTLATIKGFEVHGKAARKAAFPARMEILVPWTFEMLALINLTKRGIPLKEQVRPA